MKDEYNSGLSGPKEFAMPERQSEFNEAASEYSPAEEIKTVYEYDDIRYVDTGTLKQTAPSQKRKKRRHTKLVAYTLAASVAAVTVLGISLPEIFGGNSSIFSEEYWYREPHRKDDIPEDWGFTDKRPEISENLEPNGPVDFELEGERFEAVILDEDYILIETGGEVEYIHINENRQESANMYSGTEAFYDAKENVLYLKGFSCEFMEINMMGNGFTIDIAGSCSIGKLKVFGFHWGGSLTLTGDGALYVNQEMTVPKDEACIALCAEASRSVFILDGPELYIGLTSGCKTPILIKDTTYEDKNAFYISDRYVLPKFNIEKTVADGGFAYAINPETDGEEEWFAFLRSNDKIKAD